MKTPKTPIEFDYDLWTTEDGKCMVRVKCTGEQCEVNRETFRSLRLEEKRIRRSYAKPETFGEDAGQDVYKRQAITGSTAFLRKSFIMSVLTIVASFTDAVPQPSLLTRAYLRCF